MFDETALAEMMVAYIERTKLISAARPLVKTFPGVLIKPGLSALYQYP